MNRTTISQALIIITLPLIAAGCFSVSGAPADGGIFRSDDGGVTWTQKVFVAQINNKVQSIGNISINSIIQDPNDPATLYLATAGSGIYQTRDSGEHWAATGIATGSWSGFAIDPTSSALLYAGSGGSVLKSSDAGRTWSTIYVETRPDQAVTAVAVDPNDTTHVLIGTTTGVIIESRDYGSTWRVLSVAPGPISSLYLYPGSSIINALAGSGLIRSSDRGATWTAIPAAVTEGSASINALAISPLNPDVFEAATSLGFLRTSDGGTHWQSVRTLTSSPSPLNVDRVGVDPADPNRLYAVIGSRFHTSTDGGKTWTVSILPTRRRATALLLDSKAQMRLYLGTYIIKK